MAIEGKKFSELTEQQKADMRDAIRGYKVYSANIKIGGGNNPPVVSVRENTSGQTMAWAGAGDGSVLVYLEGSYSGYYIAIYERIDSFALNGIMSVEIRFYSDQVTDIDVFLTGGQGNGCIASYNINPVD